MGEYLFGKSFGSAQGITDPVLQDRLIGAEQRYRPQYAALELADINTFATGIPGGTDNPQYKRLEAKLAGLEAGEGGISSEEATKIARSAAGPAPSKTITETRTYGRGSKKTYQAKNKNYDKELAEYNREVQSIASSLGGNRASQIASVKAEMAQLESSPGQRGLFDLLEEQSTRAGALQREQLQLQRESDVGALQEFAPQVVKAYRAADPYSTGLADEATAQAMDPSLRNKGKSLINSKIRAASAAESALNQSGLSNINAKREAASAAEQELNKVGVSLSDLDPTEQEAILSGRGMEFAASTGELTALEKRRAQQSSREASVARGRGMDQSAVYGEMEARMAEELNKQEREIALGASLLGQQSQMRLNRLGTGAGILGQAEAMDAQRRADQLQRQQFGASTLGQSEAMSAQRRAEQLQRIQLGSGLIGQADQQLQSAFGMNRQIAGDVGMTILGRPSSAIGLGGQMLGQAQQGAAGPMGPQLFDPNMGINMALQQRSQDVNYQGAMAQASAARSAGMMQAAGSIAGGFAAACWVAREVYGIENPKWLEFRYWMYNESPSWFRNLYIKYGERIAKFISNKPLVKSIIRKWMNTKIK